MSVQTYRGSCHCGAIRFEVDMDLSEGTTRCNCSYCTKVRAWFAFVPAGRVRISSTADALADYQWVPPGKSEPNLHFRFCKSCGVRVFAKGHESALGGDFYAIAIAALDDADPDELAGSIRYVDGRHDRNDREPADTRLM
jgi:hypothetical protein